MPRSASVPQPLKNPPPAVQKTPEPPAKTAASKTASPAATAAAAASPNQNGGVLTKLLGFWRKPTKEVNLNTKTPIYDEAKGKWVFPDEQPEEEQKEAPPPPSDMMLRSSVGVASVPGLPPTGPPPSGPPPMLPPSGPPPTGGMIPADFQTSQSSGGESSDNLESSRRGPRRRGYVDTLAGGQLRQSFGSVAHDATPRRAASGFTIMTAPPMSEDLSTTPQMPTPPLPEPALDAPAS
jgi:hypothetical protein